MKQFKWRVALCDDNPQDQSISGTKTLLESAGFEVLLVSTPANFRDNALVLSRCHLALMDMDWGLVFSEEKAVEAIPHSQTFDSKNLSAYVSKWISALESWGHANASAPNRWTEWPREKIGSKEMGAWLGALLSNIAPGIEVIFYSGKPGVASSGFAAALGRFYDAAYAVETKTESAPLSLQAVGWHLAKLQCKALNRPDIYDWFLADLLLPTLLDCEMKTRDLEEPSIHEARSGLRTFQMQKGNFFPVLQQDADPSGALRAYFRKRAFRPLDSDSLSALEHRLRPWRFDEWYTDTTLLMEELILLSQAVISTVPSAIEIASAIWSAIETLRAGESDAEASCKACLARAWELFWAMLFEPSCAFIRIATTSGGAFFSSANAPTQYPTQDTADARKEAAVNCKLARIDLQALGRACTHLKTNGTGKLDILDEQDVVTITWRGDWNGDAACFDQFREKVRESLKKPLGAHRGLPSVILFGLANGAESMRVAIGGKWHTLFPASTASSSASANGYEFEWKFRKE